MERKTDITQAIKTAGLKVTPQRRTVYEVMQELQHASVDTVIEKVRERNPDITVSTIYRILDSFCRAKVLSSVGDGKQYFDITVGNHHHLFDGQKIADYDDPELTRLIYRYLAGKLPGDTNIDKIQVQIIINHLKSE